MTPKKTTKVWAYPAWLMDPEIPIPPEAPDWKGCVSRPKAKPTPTQEEKTP